MGDETNGATIGHIQELIQVTQLQTVAAEEQTAEARALRGEISKLCVAQTAQRSTCGEHMSLTDEVAKEVQVIKLSMQAQHSDIATVHADSQREIAGAVNSLHLSIKELSSTNVKQAASARISWYVAGIGIVMLGLAVLKFLSA